jgi:hypothetical protein
MLIEQTEVYTFTPDDGSPAIHIRSGVLTQTLARVHYATELVAFPPEDEAHIIARHGIEEARMATMTEEDAQLPLVVGLIGDARHILIDGAHRRLFWARRGVDSLQAWVVPEAYWRLFTFSMDDPTIIAVDESGLSLPQRRTAL